VWPRRWDAEKKDGRRYLKKVAEARDSGARVCRTDYPDEIARLLCLRAVETIIRGIVFKLNS
jgi:hypothetical protein